MGTDHNHVDWLKAALMAERKRRELTFEQVARGVGRALGGKAVPKQYVHGWESLGKTPEMDKLAAWAEALGFTLELELLRQGEERAVVYVPRDLAKTCRQLAILATADRALIVPLIERLALAVEKKSSDG